MAGGVVVENKGMIRNTANYANATASASDRIVGGIAVVNSGTIENCMSIGALSTKENGIAGGIVESWIKMAPFKLHIVHKLR